MSAVPKKKLCWNCEGNVSLGLDNCPYCGVYVYSPEQDDNSVWNPSYQPNAKTEEIPSPLYQINQQNNEEHLDLDDEEHSPFSGLFSKLKQDLFPILFLMMGSSFFLFGIILLLFSQNGSFTLQWQGSDGFYFLLGALPLMILGWKYFLQMDDSKE